MILSSSGGTPGTPKEEDVSAGWDAVVQEISGDEHDTDDVVNAPTVLAAASNMSLDVPSVPSDEGGWESNRLD